MGSLRPGAGGSGRRAGGRGPPLRTRTATGTTHRGSARGRLQRLHGRGFRGSPEAAGAGGFPCFFLQKWERPGTEAPGQPCPHSRGPGGTERRRRECPRQRDRRWAASGPTAPSARPSPPRLAPPRAPPPAQIRGRRGQRLCRGGSGGACSGEGSSSFTCRPVVPAWLGPPIFCTSSSPSPPSGSRQGAVFKLSSSAPRAPLQPRMGALPLPKDLEVRRGHSLHSLCKHILGMCVGECLLKAGEEAAGTGPGAAAATVPVEPLAPRREHPALPAPPGLQPPRGIGCGGVAPPRAPLASEEAELLERRREGLVSGPLAGRTWPGRGTVCWFPAPGLPDGE